MDILHLAAPCRNVPVTFTLDVRITHVPNCDFLAVGSDIDAVLSHVFECGDFHLYEAYSPFNKELMQFRTLNDLRSRYPSLGECVGKGPSVLLQLFVPKTGRVNVQRIDLDPAKCDGATLRYKASGWGLIQLQFGGVGPEGLVASRTNHNSLKRAMKWEPHYREELGSALAWDWPGIEKASRRLNRFIAKLAARRDGSRPVLPEASRFLDGADV